MGVLATVAIIFIVVIVIILISVGIYYTYKKGYITSLMESLKRKNNVPSSNTYDITQYGGSTSSKDNSKALSDAFAAASKTKGVVVIPSGTFNCSHVDIKDIDGVNLYITGTLAAIPSIADSGVDTSKVDIGMFYFTNCSNMIISGSGKIDGNGSIWWPTKDQNRRPSLVVIKQCKNITYRQVTISNPAFYHFMIYNTDQITFTNFSIDTPSDSPNTDGIHVYGGVTNMSVKSVKINCGDDGIAINAESQTSGESGATSNVTIEDLTITGGHGCSLGSTIYDKISNVTFNGVTETNTQYGCRIKVSNATGKNANTPGSVTNCTFSNFTMKNVDQGAIVITTYYQKDSPNKIVTFSEIKYQNITCDTCGWPDTFNIYSSSQLKNPIVLDNIKITNPGRTTSDGSYKNVVKNAKFTLIQPVVGMVLE